MNSCRIDEGPVVNRGQLQQHENLLVIMSSNDYKTSIIHNTGPQRSWGGQGKKLSKNTGAFFPEVIYTLGCPWVLCSVLISLHCLGAGRQTSSSSPSFLSSHLHVSSYMWASPTVPVLLCQVKLASFHTHMLGNPQITLSSWEIKRSQFRTEVSTAHMLTAEKSLCKWAEMRFPCYKSVI